MKSQCLELDMWDLQQALASQRWGTGSGAWMWTKRKSTRSMRGTFPFMSWGFHMREALTITILEEVTKRGTEVIAYAPEAVETSKAVYLKGAPKVSYGTVNTRR